MSETEHLEPVLRSLSEGHIEVRNDLDDLAERVLRIVHALIAADGALAERVGALERIIRTIADPDSTPRDTHIAARREFGMAFPAPELADLVPLGSVRYVGPPRSRPGLLSRLFHRR